MRNDHIAGNIYVTNDYDKFKRLEGNRDVKTAKKVLDSINAVGYVLSPILVNEKFEIIDGQHRLEALKKLNLPVYYIMQPGIGEEECKYLNTGQTNWTTMDYIQSYSEKGIKDYLRLSSLLLEFGKSFKLEGVISFTTSIPLSGGTMHQLIKDRKLKISEEQYNLSRTRLRSAKELGFCSLQKEGKFYCRSWYQAVAYAYRHQEVSVRELAERLKSSPIELQSYNRVEDQLALFDKIYNKGRKKGKVFMSSDYQLGKYKEKEVE